MQWEAGHTMTRSLLQLQKVKNTSISARDTDDSVPGSLLERGCRTVRRVRTELSGRDGFRSCSGERRSGSAAIDRKSDGYKLRRRCRHERAVSIRAGSSTNSRFCPECGSSVAAAKPAGGTCSSCGHSSEAPVKFCPECGGKMQTWPDWNSRRICGV